MTKGSQACGDGSVMTPQSDNVTIHAMTTIYIQKLVLQEFRLKDADMRTDAERIVAASWREAEPAIPLLTSIDDPCDVATLRGLHSGETDAADPAQRAALGRLVSSWKAPLLYGPRLTERSESRPSYYRLAVTESGINQSELSFSARRKARPTGSGITSSRIGLLWIGAPIGTHAGLLVLVGHYDDRPFVSSDIGGWPLPLSTALGVRIYESHGIGADDIREHEAAGLVYISAAVPIVEVHRSRVAVRVLAP